MLPYLKHQSDQDTNKRRPMEFEQIIEAMGDVSDLAVHDLAIKFWIPQPVADALHEIKAIRGESVSEILRVFFLGHCYGFYFQQAIVTQHPELVRDSFNLLADIPASLRRSNNQEDESNQKKRITVYYVPELGKNTAPMKVWLPKRLRNDLEILAKHANLKLSNYIREIVISRVFGHGTLPMRPKMLEALPTEAAEDWGDGKDVPWREISPEERFDKDVIKSETREVL